VHLVQQVHAQPTTAIINHCRAVLVPAHPHDQVTALTATFLFTHISNTPDHTQHPHLGLVHSNAKSARLRSCSPLLPRPTQACPFSHAGSPTGMGTRMPSRRTAPTKYTHAHRLGTCFMQRRILQYSTGTTGCTLKRPISPAILTSTQLEASTGRAGQANTTPQHAYYPPPQPHHRQAPLPGSMHLRLSNHQVLVEPPGPQTLRATTPPARNDQQSSLESGQPALTVDVGLRLHTAHQPGIMGPARSRRCLPANACATAAHAAFPYARRPDVSDTNTPIYIRKAGYTRTSTSDAAGALAVKAVLQCNPHRTAKLKEQAGSLPSRSP